MTPDSKPSRYSKRGGVVLSGEIEPPPLADLLAAHAERKRDAEAAMIEKQRRKPKRVPKLSAEERIAHALERLVELIEGRR